MTEADWAIFVELASLVALVDDDLDPLLDVPRDKLVDRVAADPQVLLDPLQNVVAAGQHGIEPEPRQRAELVEGFEVERVVRGDPHLSVLASQGQDGMPEDGRSRKLRQQLPVDLDPLQLDERQPQGVGQRLEGVFLVDQARLDEDAVDPPPGRLADGRDELLSRDETALEKEFADIHEGRLGRVLRPGETRRAGRGRALARAAAKVPNPQQSPLLSIVSRSRRRRNSGCPLDKPASANGLQLKFSVA